MATLNFVTRSSSPNGMYSTREATVDTLIVHHAATSSISGVLDMIASGAREVSANFVVKDDQIVMVVPPQYRAWTSGSSSDGGAGARWDHRSITIEVCNDRTGDASGWPISEASYRSIVKIVMWMKATYPNFRIDRNRILGHRELWERYRASYPTACPGGIDVDKIVRMALVNKEEGFLMALNDKEQAAFYQNLQDATADSARVNWGVNDNKGGARVMISWVLQELKKTGNVDSKKLSEELAKALKPSIEKALKNSNAGASADQVADVLAARLVK